MQVFETWLEAGGPRVAAILDAHREVICDTVAMRMSTAFPSLCLDPARFDAIAFQQEMFQNTPRRFHRLMQVVLRLQAMVVIEREYRWGWTIIPRYGVARHHVISHARWYFDAARSVAPFRSSDVPYLDDLEGRVLHTIDQITVVPGSAAKRHELNSHSNGYSNGHHERMPR
ncbi:MAG: hypothetical protein IPO81_00960 [Kouleothrix sp.]|nr:hypothetical protein [Kouleothrix sp.]